MPGWCFDMQKEDWALLSGELKPHYLGKSEAQNNNTVTQICTDLLTRSWHFVKIISSVHQTYPKWPKIHIMEVFYGHLIHHFCCHSSYRVQCQPSVNRWLQDCVQEGVSSFIHGGLTGKRFWKTFLRCFEFTPKFQETFQKMGRFFFFPIWWRCFVKHDNKPKGIGDLKPHHLILNIMSLSYQSSTALNAESHAATWVQPSTICSP